MEKNIYNEKKLRFVKKVALEYRLSLTNICKLLKIDATEENLKTMYEALLKTCRNQDEQTAFNWLLNETTNEPEKDSNVMYLTATTMLARYAIAIQSGDKKQIDEAFVRLFKTDYNFNTLVEKMNPRNISEEDIAVISKYRIKYALSKSQIASMIGINRETIARNEKKYILESEKFQLENGRLCSKLDKLNDMILSERNQRYVNGRKRI